MVRPGRLYGPAGKGIFMSDDILLLAQSFVDIISWFLLPFAFMLSISWVVSFFRR